LPNDAPFWVVLLQLQQLPNDAPFGVVLLQLQPLCEPRLVWRTYRSHAER
jgi:hypothetical protein